MLWAKNSIQNNFIFFFQNSRWCGYPADDDCIQRNAKGLSGNLPGKIVAVKADDIQRVALKYLPAEKAVILVVGSEKEFDTPLTKFGYVNAKIFFELRKF